MSQKEQATTVEIDLKALEVRVEELIRACDYLKQENKTLKVKQENLVAERAALVEKTEMARSRIEAMITRLKSLET
jgi:cell division protein ZapB